MLKVFLLYRILVKKSKNIVFCSFFFDFFLGIADRVHTCTLSLRPEPDNINQKQYDIIGNENQKIINLFTMTTNLENDSVSATIRGVPTPELTHHGKVSFELGLIQSVEYNWVSFYFLLSSNSQNHLKSFVC